MSKKFQTGNVVTISVSHLFHDTYTAFLAPLLPLLIAKLGISLSLAGLLDVVRKIPALFNPFIGLLADKVSVKYFVVFAPAVSAVAMSLLGASSSYFVVLLLLFITGISSALFHVPAPVMIRQFSGKKTATGMSFFMFGGELARTLGPLFIIWGISVWGLEGSWRVMPVGIAASFVLLYKLRNISSLTDGHRKIKQKGAAETLKELIPFFIFIAGFQLFRAGMKAALTLYLPTFLTGRGESLWLAGISLSMLQFAGALGTFGTGFVSDKIGHRNTLFITALISPFVMWMFIGSSELFKIPLLLVMGVLLFASGPVLLALVQETTSERPAFINSIYMTINFSISSLMVLFIGISGDRFGLEWTYQISAGLAFLSVPFVFILPKKGN